MAVMRETTLLRKLSFARSMPFPLPVAIALLIALLISLAASDLRDFDYFYSAGLAFRLGQNPYSVHGFYSPLMILVYFAPLSVLPIDLAFRLNAFICLSAFIVAFWKISKGDTATFILLMITPFPYLTAYYGNIEWLIILTLVLDPSFGVLAAMLKPQLGFVIAAVLLLDLWRVRRLRAVLLAIVIIGVYVASYAAGMRWENLTQTVWNISPWPYAIPIGLVLAAYAIIKRSRFSALAATPFLSPYLGSPSSWVGLLPLLSKKRGLLIMAVIASWLLMFYWRSRL